MREKKQKYQQFKLPFVNTDGIGAEQKESLVLPLHHQKEEPLLTTSKMLEDILSRENMTQAYKRIKSNNGSSGVDGMSLKELKPFLDDQWAFIKAEILEGVYLPSPVLKVEIPKESGGKRMLGIPTVLDRLIQQAISQQISKLYDRGFSDNSYGFRPGRNAHQAVCQAKLYVNSGHTKIIDLDLEKFFDKVNHDYLMHLLSKRIGDKRLLKLIRKYLTAGMMSDGITEKRESGTPQGSPLSPVLSNIMLDELDKELERRGHKFVRYADDCSIYVRSNKSAQRVLAGISNFIEDKLKLKVNQAKSGIRTPETIKVLGFTFYMRHGAYLIQIAPKSIERFRKKVRTVLKTMTKSYFKQLGYSDLLSQYQRQHV